MIKTNLKLPKVFQEVLNKIEADKLIIQHPPLNCRVTDTVLALAVDSAFGKGKEVVIICAEESHEKVKYLTAQWVGKVKEIRKVQYSGVVVYRADNQTGGTLVITKEPDKVFSAKVDWVITIKASSFQKNPANIITADRYTYTGLLTRRGNWLYELRAASEVIDIDCNSFFEAFPDLIGKGLNENDPMYERHMLLKDVKPKSEISPFSVFARKRVRIRTDKPKNVLSETQKRVADQQHGTPIVPFIATKLQKRYLALKRKAVTEGKKPWFILLKYRRGGFTTTEQAMSYQMVNERPNSQVVTLADTNSKAARIFGMVSTMHNEDPSGLRLVGDSKTSMEFSNGSKFFIGTAGSKGLARGDTLQRSHWSEAAFSCPGPNQLTLIQEVKAGLIGATSNGEIVFESTPNKKNWFYNDYNDAKNGLSEFTAIFVRWFDDPMNIAKPGTYYPEEIKETITEEEKELVERHNLTIPQLAFRRESIRTYKALFPQEFPEDDESCFLSSGICYFNVLKIIEDLKVDYEPIAEANKPGGSLTIWALPIKGVEYVIGSDTSEGLGPPCDPNGGVVLRKDTGEEVALLHGRMTPKRLAKELVDLSIYYNKALLGVERNNHGHAVLMAIKDLGYGQSHWLGGSLYFHSNLTAGSKAKHFEDQKASDSRAGWDTNLLTRPVMLAELQEAYDNGLLKPKSKIFLQECSTFTLIGSKWEASPGNHDDVVVMFAIAWQMLGTPIRKAGIIGI